MIAQLSGNTLGRLISVDEEKGLLDDVLEEIKNSDAYRLGMGTTAHNFERKVYKKLLFKFEMK